MAPPAGCVVGIDGLPLGTHAVVVIDGEITTAFDVVDDAGRAVDLERRVVEVIRRASAEAGIEVAEVRLLCVDDGSAGERIGRLGDRLTAAGVRFHVFDRLGTSGVDESSASASVARARSVALR